MFQYIEYVADLLLRRLGFPVLYYENNPVSLTLHSMPLLTHRVLDVVPVH